MARPTRRERCEAGRHTPSRSGDAIDGTVRRDICRCCGAQIMRTQATRTWFAIGLMATTPAGQMSPG